MKKNNYKYIWYLELSKKLRNCSEWIYKRYIGIMILDSVRIRKLIKDGTFISIPTKKKYIIINSINNFSFMDQNETAFQRTHKYELIIDLLNI